MRHLEENLQIVCVRWFAMQYREYATLLHHSPNGGKRNAREAARFKEMGTRPGFPDLLLLHPNGNYHFLAIELKTDKGRQSHYQRQWQDMIEREGGMYVIIRSLQQFIDTVDTYMQPLQTTR